jgi:hypothetical protein
MSRIERRSFPTVSIDTAVLHDLKMLIGRRCTLQGTAWRLIDILPGEGLVILEGDLQRPPIQMDQYGRPSHRANEIRQIPILADDHAGLHHALREVLDALQPRT